MLVDEDRRLLLVSRKGMSIRFTATDEALRPMGRATSGVIGMHFREDDELLGGIDVVHGRMRSSSSSPRAATPSAPRSSSTASRAAADWASRSPSCQDDRGDLAGALIVDEDDEVLVVLASGKVVRSSVAEVPAKGRDTMGVVFAKPDEERPHHRRRTNSERGLEGEEPAEGEDTGEDTGENAADVTENRASTPDDVTLAEDGGLHEESAAAESVPAPESDESSGNAELDEDNTGGNE